MRGLREILLALAFGFGAAITSVGLDQLKAERSCIPPDAVEETPREIVDAWYSAERCRDLDAPSCGERF